eukprot:10488228-Alexandrium_andersonii.AAC.1
MGSREADPWKDGNTITPAANTDGNGHRAETAQSRCQHQGFSVQGNAVLVLAHPSASSCQKT